MQVCDFCGVEATRGDLATIRRFRMDICDKDPKSSPMWAERSYWWTLDLCSVCLKQFVKNLDNLVQATEDENPPRIVSKGVEEEMRVMTPKR